MRSRLLYFVSSVAIVLSVVGCNHSHEPLRFTGETDTWEAEFVVTHIGDQFHEEELVLSYKGEEQLKSNVRVEFSTVSGSGSADTPVIGGQKVFKMKGGGNGAIPTKEDIVHVKVQWNEEAEELKLIHKSNGER